MPKIVIENSPEAPEPTEEQIAASMKDPVYSPDPEDMDDQEVRPVEIKPEPVAQVGRIVTLPDTDVEHRIKVGDKEYSEAELQEFIEASKKKVTNLPDATEPSSVGKMLVANCFVKTTKVGSTVPLQRVTPAEVMFLSAEHHAEAGGNPIVELEIIGEVVRSTRVELQRMSSKYSPKKLALMFPGAIPQMPTSYRQAVEIGVGTTLPIESLTQVDLAKV